VTDAEGRFRFDGLIAGAHQLVSDRSPRFDRSRAPIDIQLAAGEVREVQIDARDHGTARVDLTIWIGAHPAAKRVGRLTRDTKIGRAIRLGTTTRTDASSALRRSRRL